MFLKKIFANYGLVKKSLLWNYYFEWIYIQNQGMNINNHHIFYHNLILKAYSNIYHLMSLCDLAIINFDKVLKLEGWYVVALDSSCMKSFSKLFLYPWWSHFIYRFKLFMWEYSLWFEVIFGFSLIIYVSKN